MQTLEEIWLMLSEWGYASDKGSVHSYLPIYEEILAPYRETAKNVLEVGLFKGDSLRLWSEYFSKKTKVKGIDCDEQPHGGMADLRPMIELGWPIHIGDAENQNDIEKFFRGIKFDVISEDAGHDLMQQLKIYYNLKPYLAKGAVYCIEDIQDIDGNKSFFEAFDPDKKIEIIDLRSNKGRYDDVMVIIRDK